jgi:hypothetical protein
VGGAPREACPPAAPRVFVKLNIKHMYGKNNYVQNYLKIFRSTYICPEHKIKTSQFKKLKKHFQLQHKIGFFKHLELKNSTPLKAAVRDNL